jgi:drug/metabolite transporter superfamily protein YnfA
MTVVRTLTLLLAAALLEAGGDALIRRGLNDRMFLLLGLGGAALVAYGVLVNVSGLPFGRMIGSYIAIFFLVSQVMGVLIFHDAIDWRMVAGGALIVAGGCVLLT